MLLAFGIMTIPSSSVFQRHYEIAMKMMLTESAIEFDEFLAQLKSIANTGDMKYMKDNWLNCIPMWAKHKRFGNLKFYTIDN